MGIDGGVNGPALAAGVVPPGTGSSSRLEVNADGERRASEPGVDGPRARPPRANGPSQVRPMSLVEDGGRGDRQKRLPQPPPVPNLPLDDAQTSSRPPAVDGKDVYSAPTTPPPSSLLTTLRIPSSSKLPSFSPTSPGRFTTPRRSMTMNNAEALHTSGTPGTVVAGKDEEKQQGIMKRASRKMSLNGGTIRLSGFGFGHHKEKDKS